MDEVDFLKEENTKLKRELLTLQESTRLQKKARNKKYYNPKKNWSQFHVLVSDITKQYLFKKIPEDRTSTKNGQLAQIIQF